MKNISEIIRKKLKDNNIKNVELANYLGIKPQNLISLLQTENWSFNNVVRCSEFLNINLNEFLDNNSMLLKEPDEVYKRNTDPFIQIKEMFDDLERRINDLEKKR